MIAESVLVEEIENNFTERCWFVEKEVPLLSKRIDIIALDIEKDVLIAVEVKVKNWKRAFRQALRYKLCSDETYVALHSKYIHNIDLRKFEKNGIGVISIHEGGDIDIILKPQRNDSYHYDLKKKVIQYLKGSRGGSFEHE